MKGKNNAILLTVIGIATLLVAIVGATFAYFTAQTKYNDTTSTLTIQSASGGTATFLGGEVISVDNIYPRNESWVTKTVNVTYQNTTTTLPYQYELTLNYDNQFTDDYLTYTFTRVESTDDPVCLKNGALTSEQCTGSEMVKSTTNGTLITETSNGVFKNTSTGGTRAVSLGTGTFQPTTGEEVANHVYLLTISFPNQTSTNQNVDQGKVMSARITYSEVRA